MQPKIILVIFLILFSINAGAASHQACEISNTSPGGGYTEIFSVSGTDNAHAAQLGIGMYGYSMWCDAPYVAADCGEAGAVTLLRISSPDNAHAESADYIASQTDPRTPEYEEADDICIKYSGQPQTYCESYADTCPTNRVEILSLTDAGRISTTNSHVTGVDSSGEFTTKVCCGWTEPTPTDGCTIVGRETLTFGRTAPYDVICYAGGSETTCGWGGFPQIGYPTWSVSPENVLENQEHENEMTAQMKAIGTGPVTITADWTVPSVFYCGRTIEVGTVGADATGCTVSIADTSIEIGETTDVTVFCTKEGSGFGMGGNGTVTDCPPSMTVSSLNPRKATYTILQDETPSTVNLKKGTATGVSIGTAAIEATNTNPALNCQTPLTIGGGGTPEVCNIDGTCDSASGETFALCRGTENCPPPTCGNEDIDAEETCSNCPQDVGECEVLPPLGEGDMVSITLTVMHKDGRVVDETTNSIFSRVDDPIKIAVTIQATEDAQGKTPNVTITLKSRSGNTITVGGNPTNELELFNEDITLNSEQINLRPSATVLLDSTIRPGSYEIKAVIETLPYETQDNNNEDTELIVITSGGGGGTSDALAAPEIHPIFILLVLLAVVVIIGRNE